MSKFFQFMSGDFLRHPKLQKWYPYLLLLIVLAAISIANEKMINRKNKLIQKKQYEYKVALSQLKENNHYLPYNQKKEIRNKATKRGFIENHKNIYKIPVND
ncbi:MAG: FtsL-like putative cell division protein [Bacteroidetes bacterium]|nr:FtsL-like putative cell division protein [Bacteroidota bacterium]MCL2302630.1 FtsL-like putative cell division protein [Lentimicrobiaceae bacterium]